MAKKPCRARREVAGSAVNDGGTSGDGIAMRKNGADMIAVRVYTGADDAEPEGKGMEEAADHAGWRRDGAG